MVINMSSSSGRKRYCCNRRGGRYYKRSQSPSSSSSSRSSRHHHKNCKGRHFSKVIAKKHLDRDIEHSREQYFEKLRILKTLGEGKFGTCYLVTDEKNLFALKLLKKKKYQKNPRKAKYEEDILNKLRHEAIPRFIRKIDDESLIGFVLEYKQGITLETMIFSQGYVFTRNEIYNIGKQLIDILKYLHGEGVVHRDIRLPNILFNDNRIYLVDFGLARWMDNKNFKPERDFSCLGDILLHLYYTSFTDKPKKSRPWYEELSLSSKELVFLKKLMGNEKRYKNISEVEMDFEEMFINF
jgi:serine/threonine protein kinase